MAGTIARAAQVVDDDLGAAPRQFDRIGAAPPAARTGHDGHTPVEIDRHDEPPKIATHWVSQEHRHVLNRSSLARSEARRVGKECVNMCKTLGSLNYKKNNKTLYTNLL